MTISAIHTVNAWLTDKHRLAVPIRRAGAMVARAAGGVLSGLVMLAETSARAELLRQLQTLSDAELAKKGLRREDIAAHVFRDRMF